MAAKTFGKISPDIVNDRAKLVAEAVEKVKYYT
jgi:hypothetical protein